MSTVHECLHCYGVRVRVRVHGVKLALMVLRSGFLFWPTNFGSTVNFVLEHVYGEVSGCQNGYSNIPI